MARGDSIANLADYFAAVVAEIRRRIERWTAVLRA
jgi:hypothetical protein